MLTNCPKIPKEPPDMCETCGSVQREGSRGHHTFLTCGWGYFMTDGRALWYCSPQCFLMTNLPTLDAPEHVYEYIKGRCDPALFDAWLKKTGWKFTPPADPTPTPTQDAPKIPETP